MNPHNVPILDLIHINFGTIFNHSLDDVESSKAILKYDSNLDRSIILKELLDEILIQIEKQLESIANSDNEYAKNLIRQFEMTFGRVTLLWLMNSEEFQMQIENDNNTDSMEIAQDFYHIIPKIMVKQFPSTILIALKTIEIEDFWRINLQYDYDSLNCIMNFFDNMESYKLEHLHKFPIDLINSCHDELIKNGYCFYIAQLDEKFSEYTNFIYEIIKREFKKSIDELEHIELDRLMGIPWIKEIIFFILFLNSIIHTKEKMVQSKLKFSVSDYYNFYEQIIPFGIHFKPHLAIVFERFNKLSVFFVEKVSKYDLSIEFCLKNIIQNDDLVMFDLFACLPHYSLSNFSTLKKEFIRSIKNAERLNIKVTNSFIKKIPDSIQDLIDHNIENIKLISHLMDKSKNKFFNYLNTMKLLSKLYVKGNNTLVYFDETFTKQFIELIDVELLKTMFLHSSALSHYSDVFKASIFSKIYERKLDIISEANGLSNEIKSIETHEFYKECLIKRIRNGRNNENTVEMILWFWNKEPTIFDEKITNKILIYFKNINLF